LKNQPPPPFKLPGAAAPRGTFGEAAPYRGVDLFDPLGRTKPPVLRPPPPVRSRPQQKTPAQISHLYELALTSAAMSFHEAALENLQQVTALAPDHAAAWTQLAKLLRLAERDEEADAADAKAAAIDSTATQWRDATVELTAARLEQLDRKLRLRLEKMPDEERIGFLRDVLFADPLDFVAMRYLANEENLADDGITCVTLLHRAIDVAPNYLAARLDLAQQLVEQRDFLAVLTQSEYLLAAEPNNVRFRQLHADAAVQAERQSEALPIYESLLEKDPGNIEYLNAYGSLLKTIGRREDAVKAFRKVLSIKPDSGAAYYGLSELKAKYLTTADIADMHRYLKRGVNEVFGRKGMAYALGATLERAGDYRGSFEAYAFGAAACLEEVAGTPKEHDPEKFAERLARSRRVFTAESIAACAPPPGAKVPDVTPIFVLGMPRAGSTLVEQILASHSLVEGTRELPVIGQMTKQLAMSRVLVNNDCYPERVVQLNRAQLDALGRECLAKIGKYRNTTQPYVIDKRPWNWLDIPFIHSMLPHAKFIDIRRAPMAAGFAMFKQLLPPDSGFSCDLTHLGHYYRNYVEFMDYLDTILPGRILRVWYPKLVDDTETEIRRMLDYCGLPFEERCLRFWETDRAVVTPSAEQVRRPIFRDALEQWRNYEPWLGKLREALGDLAET
jgi:tetratricopeptide (TPR) repeat protein